MIDWDKYPNFSEKEMACKCGCGRADMSPDFMSMLQSLRNAVGRIVITSGFRCETYNTSLKGGPAHPLGRAADISVSRQAAYALVKVAFLYGFTGIGWQQHGNDRFVHLDDLTTKETGLRPTVWSY